MGAARVITEERSWFADAHRPDRTLRVSPHPTEGVVTLSVWDGHRCVATHRIARESVPDLVGCLAGGLVAAPPAHLSVVRDAPPPAAAHGARPGPLVAPADHRHPPPPPLRTHAARPF